MVNTGPSITEPNNHARVVNSVSVAVTPAKCSQVAHGAAVPQHGMHCGNRDEAVSNHLPRNIESTGSVENCTRWAGEGRDGISAGVGMVYTGKKQNCCEQSKTR